MRKNKLYAPQMKFFRILSASILLLIGSLYSQEIDRPGRTPKPKPRYVLSAMRDIIEEDINFFRHIHRIPRLKHKKQHDDFSTQQAGNLYKTGLLNKTSIQPSGELLAPQGYFPLTAQLLLNDPIELQNRREFNVVYDWYGFRRFYPGGYSNSSHALYGFYTQLIWKASTEIGIGFRYGYIPNGQMKLVIVVNFYPPGNDPNEFELNIVPSKEPIPTYVDIFDWIIPK